MVSFRGRAAGLQGDLMRQWDSAIRTCSKIPYPNLGRTDTLDQGQYNG